MEPATFNNPMSAYDHEAFMRGKRDGLPEDQLLSPNESQVFKAASAARDAATTAEEYWYQVGVMMGQHATRKEIRELS